MMQSAAPILRRLSENYVASVPSLLFHRDKMPTIRPTRAPSITLFKPIVMAPRSRPKEKVASPRIARHRKASEPAKSTTSAKQKRPAYIVGMGGSAGALEAFEQFFTHMPVDSGLAFVLISHLDPTHKGMMPELLSRSTAMKVVQAEDGMGVLPNQIHIIPPNKDMTILRGVLHLHEPISPRGVRAPIDLFLRHLAEDQEERSIAVIMSGMGTDGTLGVKAVKEHLGLALVQDTRSAKYDSMPKSAVGTGLVDYVAAAQDLPQKLMGYVRHSTKIPRDVTAQERTVSSHCCGFSPCCGPIPDMTFPSTKRTPCIGVSNAG